MYLGVPAILGTPRDPDLRVQPGTWTRNPISFGTFGTAATTPTTLTGDALATLDPRSQAGRREHTNETCMKLGTIQYHDGAALGLVLRMALWLPISCHRGDERVP